MAATAWHVDERKVAYLTLSRPEARNALNAELISAVLDHVRSAGDGVRALVIRGEGPSFCAGADLRVASEDVPEQLALYSDMVEALYHCPVPVVGRVQGATIGGGMGFVSCCDVVVAADSAFFALREVRLGLVPGVVLPYVVRRAGIPAATELALGVSRMTAQRSLEIGLVQRVVAQEALDDEVETVIASLTQESPSALRLTKALMRRIAQPAPESFREICLQVSIEARLGDEALEGIAAFFDKRPANWK